MLSFLAAGLLTMAVASGPSPWFEDVTDRAAIPSLKHGEGVSIVDVNHDDHLDLYLPCVRDQGRLLKNLGDGRFADITSQTGLNEKGGVGAAIGDLDGDQRPDIYVARGADPYVAPHLILLQRADGTFKNVAEAAGVGKISNGLTVILADFNGDGARDAFLPGWSGDTLLFNNGNGHFTDVSQPAGMIGHGRGWAALASDFDGDGKLDIYASHGSPVDQHDSRLYLNRGQGRFSEASAPAGLGSAPWSMGVVSADFDGDGDFDLYVSGYNGRGKLYRNDGKAHFSDVTTGSGLTAEKCVGAAVGQLDDDLLPDIVVAGFAGPVRIYKNLGEMRFSEVVQSGLKSFNRNEGLALADLDNDGDLDLYVSNVEGHNRLYRNRLDSNRYLKIRFTQQLHAVEGAVARLRLAGTVLATQEISGAVGMGQGPPEFLFRLPDAGPVDLEVTLPGGEKLEKKAVAPGLLLLP